MSPSARSGFLEALLQVAAILVLTVTWTQGQITTFGGCPNYQTSPGMDNAFNVSMIAETAGFKILLTTENPATEGCYVFTFKSDEKFSLTYKDNNYNEVKHEGRFEFQPKTYLDSGSIYLGLPGSMLGAGLFGGSRMYIIYIPTDGSYFVAISCGSSGILKTEHVHVFVRASAATALTPEMITGINSTLESEKIPHATKFRTVDQSCTKPPPGDPTAPPSGGLLQKLMALCPGVRDLISEYRSDLDSSSASTSPDRLFTSNYDIPVQDITYSRIDNPVSLIPNHQFISNNGAPVQFVTHPIMRNTGPLQPRDRFTSQNGFPIQVMTYPMTGNSAPSLSNQQFSVNNGVPGQMQHYYLYNPALPAVGFSPSSVIRPPYSGLQNSSPRMVYVSSNVNNPQSVGQQYVTAGSPYYSSSPDVSYGYTAVHHSQPLVKHMTHSSQLLSNAI